MLPSVLAMKQRLCNWGNLFEKYENLVDEDEDEPDSAGSNSYEDGVDISSELNAVSEEHSMVRQALCLEIGVTEKELKESFKAHQHTDQISPKLKSSKQKESSKNVNDLENSFPESPILLNRSNNKRKKRKSVMTIQRKLQSNSNQRRTIQRRKKIENRQSLKRKIPIQKSDITSDMQIARSEQKSASPYQFPESQDREPVEQGSLLNSLTCDIELSRDHGEIITSNNSASAVSQSQVKDDVRKFVEQYDLWKLHQRIKSGQCGSVFIVSSLDDEPSEQNRYIPDLPEEMEEPVRPTKRRFSLKKSY